MGDSALWDAHDDADLAAGLALAYPEQAISLNDGQWP